MYNEKTGPKRRVAVYFRNNRGIAPAHEWLGRLKDITARTKIYSRIERAEDGNFGDHKSVGDGVHELRVVMGPGYRVYYAIEDESIVLLMVGDKSTQEKDIRQAKAFWKEYKSG